MILKPVTIPLSIVRGGLHAPSSCTTVRFLSSSTSALSTTPPKRSHPFSSVSTKEALACASNYLLGVYARPDIVLSHGKGSYVWDTTGMRYLDFSAGIAVNSLGHADEGLIKVMTEQAGKLIHTSNVWHNEWAGMLAELLVKTTKAEGGLGFAKGTESWSGGGAKVFFANSGTEANEGALKIARKVGKDLCDENAVTKTRIACFKGSFHGRSMGALSVTSNPKYQAPFAPLLPGIDVGTLNDEAELVTLVTQDTCAVIVEPVQGEGGVNSAREDWLRALRRRCSQTGAVLIFDEIQCGLFRTGQLWAHSAFPVDCHPDIITMAKPLANGYPIGAVMLRDGLAETMTPGLTLPGTHGTTFGGSPLACALGHYTLSKLSTEASVDQIKEISEYLMERLEQLVGRFPDILQPEVRGRGLILGLGFRDGAHPVNVVRRAREVGLLVLTAGTDVVRLVPSLTITKTEVDQAIDLLSLTLTEI